MSLSSVPLFQCVPNFSEGRRQDIVTALAAAVMETPGARLIDASFDEDHNRSVLTFLGDADAVQHAALATARVAVERIDLRGHAGAHPRSGALDVLPVVPIRNAGRAEAVRLARAISQQIGELLDVPVFLYEWAALPDRESALPLLRAHAARQILAPTETLSPTPDYGPAFPHPSAGVAIVGARGPLVAYNVNLATPDIGIARAIAARIRRERDYLPFLAGVRALGLPLAARHLAQVSLNLTRPELSPLPAVFAFIRNEAAKHNVLPLESEIIGAIPLSALGGEPPSAILWRGYNPDQILDTWLSE